MRTERSQRCGPTSMTTPSLRGHGEDLAFVDPADVLRRSGEDADPGPEPGFPRAWRRQGIYIEAAPEWRATTRQVCGLWPFIAGSGTPMVGVPMGRDLRSHATVCCDPISWFARAGLIANPSMFVLGQTRASASRA